MSLHMYVHDVYGVHTGLHGMFVLLNMHADIVGIYMFADRHICVFCA